MAVFVFTKNKHLQSLNIYHLKITALNHYSKLSPLNTLPYIIKTVVSVIVWTISLHTWLSSFKITGKNTSMQIVDLFLKLITFYRRSSETNREASAVVLFISTNKHLGSSSHKGKILVAEIFTLSKFFNSLESLPLGTFLSQKIKGSGLSHCLS